MNQWMNAMWMPDFQWMWMNVNEWVGEANKHHGINEWMRVYVVNIKVGNVCE
jgi:hypothetical protein